MTVPCYPWNDYLLVYNYSGRPMQIDLSKISGAKKNAWWYSAKDGKLEYIGEFDSKSLLSSMIAVI